MASKTDLFDMATGHLGKPAVGDAETSQTPEAKKLRIYYETALNFVLSDFDWNFASKRDALALADSAEYPVDWTYAYSYPNDCIEFREIIDSSRNTGTKRIPFEIGLSSDGSSKMIYTNQENAIGRYTKKITDVNLFDPAFMLCLSFFHAALVAIPLTKKSSIKNQMLQQYEQMKFTAKGHGANESVEPADPLAESIRARDDYYDIDAARIIEV